MPLITHVATTATTTTTVTTNMTNLYLRPKERTIHCHNTAKKTAQINQQQQPHGRHHHQNPLGFTRIHCTSTFLRNNNESPLIHTVPSTPVTGENPVLIMHLHDCTLPSPSPTQFADGNQFNDYTQQEVKEEEYDVKNDGKLYKPPFQYENNIQRSLSRNVALQREHVLEKTTNNDLFLETNSIHQQDFTAYSYGHDDGDSSSLAMITPPPPYDTPRTSSKEKDGNRTEQAIPILSSSSTTLTANKKNERQYLFFNNREIFNIGSLAVGGNGGSDGGGGGVGSSGGDSLIHKTQQQSHSSHFTTSGNAKHSLGSAISNAITPTKLSAAAAAMFAAPQLNRKWTHLSRKRRRRHHNSNDCKELDKLVLKSVDWDDTDIY